MLTTCKKEKNNVKMTLFRRFFPYDKQWCVVLSLISALSWSFMDLYAGLNREIVDGATITFVNGAAICCLAVPALCLFKHELKVRVTLAPPSLSSMAPPFVV